MVNMGTTFAISAIIAVVSALAVTLSFVAIMLMNVFGLDDSNFYEVFLKITGIIIAMFGLSAVTCISSAIITSIQVAI